MTMMHDDDAWKGAVILIRIDYTDSTPIYEQIVNKFKNLIVRNVLTPEEKMPSVRTLAMELSINPNTIQKAYTELERQGFIYTVKGKGNFVAANDNLKDIKQAEIIEKLDGLLKEAKDADVDISVLIEHIQSKMWEQENDKTKFAIKRKR